MIKTKISVKVIENEERKVPCAKCNRKTNHKLLTWVEYLWDAHGDAQGTDNYEVISCCGCEDISFRLASDNSDNIEYENEYTYYHPQTEQIFPQRIVGRSPLDAQYYLPFIVKQIYNETYSALTSNLSILASVGIRVLIESICREEKTTGKNLKLKINDLVFKGLLTQNHADILHKMRFLGNRSAHEIKASTDKELSIAFDIIENLLQVIYIIPKKASSL